MNDVSNVGGNVLPDEDFSIPTAAELAAPEAAVPAGPNGFELLGLAPELVQAVADMGYTEPTAVQNAAIPKALTVDGVYADLMVSSQTGSGKTAAFLLPVLHTLLAMQADEDRATKKRLSKLACAEAAGQRRSGAEAPQAQRPYQPPQLQARRTRRAGGVPHT
jgi:Rad3-related DNA helicase